MSDPIIACFQADFERFFALVEKQIEVCPDELWGKKAGGWPFWQQVFHNLACIEIYALPEGAASQQTMYSKKVAMLSEEAKTPMSKTAIRDFAVKMRKVADSFFASTNADTLTMKHVALTTLLNRNMTNQNALIAMTRHTCYHLGCCDAILRQHGIAGVY
ncbi:MAG: DinB family protein [Desulfobulbaceae bacterium]|jgi:uncharacterized damage-inducible protein DinB|nr:DinB family protein [Desulfobulbaceae bacterium]